MIKQNPLNTLILESFWSLITFDYKITKSVLIHVFSEYSALPNKIHVLR